MYRPIIHQTEDITNIGIRKNMILNRTYGNLQMSHHAPNVSERPYTKHLSELTSLNDVSISKTSENTKPLAYWTPKEVVTWLYREAEVNGFDCQQIPFQNFQSIDGRYLLKMTRQQFLDIDPYIGNFVFTIVSNCRRRDLKLEELQRIEKKFQTRGCECILEPKFTAVGKPSPFPPDVFSNKWKETKGMAEWDHEEVMMWLCEEALNNNLNCEEIDSPNFQGITGLALTKMTKNDFVSKDRKMGLLFYDSVVKKLKEERGKHPCNVSTQQSNFEIKNKCRKYTSDGNVKRSSSLIRRGKKKEKHEKVERKPRSSGAIVRKNNNEKAKVGKKLWVFVRDLLKNPEFTPSHICWVDQQRGIFRFIQNEEIAQVWASMKKNYDYNFDKFSRAMRHYYKKDIFRSVREKLVYQFGSGAWGWRNDVISDECRRDASSLEE